MEAQKEKTTTLASLERMFDLIEFMDAAPKEVSIQEISNGIFLNKSTVFRILNTLCIRGYAFQNPETKKYGLSLAMYHVGLRAKRKMSDTQRLAPCIPDLEALRNKYQENISVSTLDFTYKKRMKVMNLMNVKTSYMLEQPERDISSLEAYTSASGKCLLAFAEKSYLSNFRGCKLEKVTPYSIDNWEDLDKELQIIRERGYAECVDEHDVGISCIAVPVFSVSGTEIKATLSLSGISSKIAKEKSPEMIQDMIAVAKRMAALF